MKKNTCKGLYSNSTPPRKKKSNSVNKELERRDLISAEWKNKKQKTSISIDGKLVRKKLYDAFIEKSSVI